MAFWRRIWQRDQGAELTACTALDIGTEFAKALVFEIDDDGKLSIVDDNVTPDRLDVVRAAVAGCPTNALSLIER